MTTITTVLGLLPLVLFPGAGSELYRGLGSVVLCGLTAATVFTMFLVPAAFTLTWDVEHAVRGWFGSASGGRPSSPDSANEGELAAELAAARE